MTKAVCLIQARMSSSRLPGKVLATIGDKPMLQHVVDRARVLLGDSGVFVITSSEDPGNEQIEEYCKDRGIPCLPAPAQVNDVLLRYTSVVEALNSLIVCEEDKIDTVIRVTSDCPLLDIELGTELLSNFILNPDLDYVAANEDFPAGIGLEVFSATALERAYLYSDTLYQMEHVTPWIREHCKTEFLGCRTDDYKHLDYSVDTMADLETVRRLLKEDPDYSVCKSLLI